MQIKYTLAALCVLFVVLAPQGMAAPRYPERVLGGPTLENMEDIYIKIYNDVNTEDDAVIFARMRQHDLYKKFGYEDPKFLFINALTAGDMQALVNRNNTPVLKNEPKGFWERLGIAKKQTSNEDVQIDIERRLKGAGAGTLSGFDQQRVFNDMQALYAEEKQLLRTENTLARQLTMKSLWGDDNLQNYEGFDVVEDMNELDRIWLGPKAVDYDPAYTRISTEVIYNTEWKPEFAPYQTQAEPQEGAAQSGYGEPVQGDGPSIAESLGRIYKSMQIMEGSGSLAATCVTKRIFEPTDLNGRKDYSCPAVSTQLNLPPKPEPGNEEERLTKGVRTQEFDTMMQQVFERENCVAYESQRAAIDGPLRGIDTFLSCGDNRVNEFALRGQTMREDIEIQLLRDQQRISKQSLEDLNQHMDAMTQMIDILSGSHACIAAKPTFE